MITVTDIIIVCAILLVLAVAGLAVYAAARVKRSKMGHIESLFEEGNFTPDEIREAVEKDQQAHTDEQNKQ